MTDIDQKENRPKLTGCMQITFDQLSPLSFFLLGYFRITISGKIYQIHFIINIIKVDRLRFPGVAEILA